MFLSTFGYNTRKLDVCLELNLFKVFIDKTVLVLFYYVDNVGRYSPT